MDQPKNQILEEVPYCCFSDGDWNRKCDCKCITCERARADDKKRVLTQIMHIVDRVNPAGRTCSINDMTKALLNIREAAFQAVAVSADHEGST